SESLVAPAACLPAGLVDQPVAHRADQAEALGDGNEDSRADEAALRMVPAHQRLGTRDLAAWRVHLRLVEKLQLAFGKGAAQVAQQVELLTGAAHHPRLEETKRGAAVALCRSHRRLGMRDQLRQAA